MLLDAFQECDPDIVIIEAFPFGRRQVRFELLPLLTHIRAMTRRPRVVTSLRDILQQRTKPGRDEETVAVALLHDIGFTLARETHGGFAAMVLGPYISEANRWMLVHHQIFLDHHVHGDPLVDRDARERWRGHPHFEWTATFVERYDQAAVSAAREILPLVTFIPMVHRLFARTPRRLQTPQTDSVRTEDR